MSVNELKRDRDLALEDQEIVGEAMARDLCEAAVEILSEKIFVGHFLKDMADTLEIRMYGEAVEIGTDIFIDESNPADNRLDTIRLIGE